ncbi:CBS domain-containing protein [Streptomyces sp. NPDC001922]|uniref:CBS domain-containing protein n=1 Tax=Streptomyces sp. NPDC001922 TaxID=3364624 RepID=UPI00368BDD66
MQHRTVADLMTHTVVSARPGTTFKDIAGLLAEHDITAVPVLDPGGRPLGVVSEGDLLRKEAGQPDPAGLLLEPRPSSAERARAEATTAEGLMSAPAVTARPAWSVIEAARVMHDHGVKRLPVVDEADRLVGVISRSDLLRVFLRRDRAIREEIEHEILSATLGEPPSAVGVEVADGRVTLTGTLARSSLVPVLVRLCRSVDGVVDVEHDLGAELDDVPARART